MNTMILNSMMDNLGTGVVTFVLGMGIVFVVLILLIYIIKGMKKRLNQKNTIANFLSVLKKKL